MKLRMLFSFLIVLFMTGLMFSSARPSSPFRSHLIEAFSLGMGTSNIRLWGKVEVPVQNSFLESLKLTVTGVSLHPFLAEGGYRACISSIHASTLVFQVNTDQYHDGDSLQFQNNEGQPLCVDFSSDANYDSYKFFPLNLQLALQSGAPQNGAFFYYPYDQTVVSADFTFTGQLYDKDNNVISNFDSFASQTFGVIAPGWEVDQIHTKKESSGTGIVFRRPFTLRILIPILLLLLFLVVVLIPFMDKFSTAIEIPVALIFGLLGIHQTILPINPPGTTAVDVFLIGIYCATVISLTAFPISRLITTIINFGRNKSTLPSTSAREKEQYVGLTNSGVYHLSSCPMLSRTTENRLLKYADEQHAEKSGKQLCQLCKARQIE